MFKIGDFSRFTRISIKMLRHYDDLGLLKPARVDTATGYRYYSASQLPRLNRIITLKDLGFSLEQIALLLDDDLPTDEIRGMLKFKRAEIEGVIRQQQERLSQIDSHLQQIDQENSVPLYPVVLRRVESQIYAMLRRVVPDDDGDDIQFMFEEVETYVAKYRARAGTPPLLLYHDNDYHEAEKDVEVAIPVNAPIPGSEVIRIRELAGGEMACVIHTGSYVTIEQAFHALLVWVEAHGYQIAGAMREVYLRFGADQIGYSIPEAYLTDIADELVTELQLPVEKIRIEGEHP